MIRGVSHFCGPFKGWELVKKWVVDSSNNPFRITTCENGAYRVHIAIPDFCSFRAWIRMSFFLALATWAPEVSQDHQNLPLTIDATDPAWQPSPRPEAAGAPRLINHCA